MISQRRQLFTNLTNGKKQKNKEVSATEKLKKKGKMERGY
jgi:hypothetical protein